MVVIGSGDRAMAEQAIAKALARVAALPAAQQTMPVAVASVMNALEALFDAGPMLATAIAAPAPGTLVAAFVDDEPLEAREAAKPQPLIVPAKAASVEAAIAEEIDAKQLPVDPNAPVELSVDDLSMGRGGEPAKNEPPRPRIYWKLEELEARISEETPASVPCTSIVVPGSNMMLLRRTQAIPGTYGGTDSVTVAYLPSSIASLKDAQGAPTEVFLCTEESPDIIGRVGRLIESVQAMLARRGRPIAVTPPPAPLSLGLGLAGRSAETDLSPEDIQLLKNRPR